MCFRFPLLFRLVLLGSVATGTGLTAFQPHMPKALPEGAIRRLPLDSQQTTETRINCVGFSPGEKELAIAAAGKEVHFFKVSTGYRIAAPLKVNGGIASIVVAPDGETLISTGFEIVARNIASGRVLHTFLSSDTPPQYAMSPQVTVLSPGGKTLASSCRNDVRFWDLRTRQEDVQRRVPLNKDSLVTCLCYSSDGTLIAGGTRATTPLPSLKFPPDKPQGTYLRLWDAATGRCLQSFLSKGDVEILACALSEDGRLLLSSSREMRPREPVELFRDRGDWVDVYHIRLWEVASGREIYSRTPDPRLAIPWLAFTADGRHFAARGKDSEVVLWDAVHGKPVHEFAVEEGGYPTLGQFLADSKTLVTAHSGKPAALYFWDAGARMKPLARKQLEPQALDQLWRDLADDDIAAARQAVWDLVADPTRSPAFLETKLTAIAARDEDAVRKLIDDLDADNFRVRQRARHDLEELSWHAAPALNKALSSKPSLLQSKSIDELIRQLNRPYTSPERLRRLRAIEVLERIGTPQAVKLLRTLAEGAPKVPETEDAKASLRRLARKDR